MKKIGTEEDINVYFERIKQFELDSDQILEIVAEISFDEDISAKWNKYDEESLKNPVPKLYNQYL